MARDDGKKTTLKNTPLKVALLLSQLILIKLGQGPIWIVKLLVHSSWFILRIVSGLKIPSYQIKVPSIHLPSYKVSRPVGRPPTRPPHYTLPLFHRGRGRPRTTPFLPFYFNKLQKFILSHTSRTARLASVIISLLLMLLIYTVVILTAAYQLPTPERLSPFTEPLTTEIYDRNGTLLYRLYDGQNRSLVKLEDIPSHLIQATISSEDKNFYHHFGIDPLAIIRALYQNQKNGHDRLQGASTITQQLVKNSLLTPEKTYTRKIKEIILALWADAIYSKEDILMMYLNTAPYGGPHTGVGAAARAYFGKEPKKLTLQEAAFLAGLPSSPTQFSPYGINPQLGIERYKQVLTRMVEDKHISPQTATQAINEKLSFRDQVEEIKAPHFVFYVKDWLAQKYGPKQVSQGGLKITTTLDMGLQQEVEKIVKAEVDGLALLNVKNGAAMVTDAKTGQILAMAGSVDYGRLGFGQFNATLSLRQPGSAIKVITYATAFKKGYSPGNTILDTPVNFRDQWGNAYAPVNYDGGYYGPISIRSALANSRNVPAVRTLATLGLDSVIQTARDLGITTFDDPKRYGLALTLGAAEVKMIEMMAVYNTFSQMGVFHKPTPILKVTDSSGNILEEYQDRGKEVLAAEVTYLITDILSDNRARTQAFGPSSLLNIPGQVVAVKTGTSNDKKDNVAYGYTSDFVVGAWVGNADGQPMNQALTSGVTGATPIWHKITKGLLAKHPSQGFSKPSGIVEVVVDGRKDLAISGNIPKGLVRTQKDKDKTIYFDAFSSYATSSAQAAVKNETTN